MTNKQTNNEANIQFKYINSQLILRKKVNNSLVQSSHTVL